MCVYVERYILLASLELDFLVLLTDEVGGIKRVILHVIIKNN